MGRGVRVLFGQFEEGLHLFERVVGDVRGLDRVQPCGPPRRMVRVEDEHRALRCDRSRGDQMDVLPTADGIEELIRGGLGVDKDDGLLVGSRQCCRLVEIVDDDTPFEAIDHAVAEADRDDCCPDGGGRAGQLGGHGGQDALHPVRGDGDVDGPVAVHVDQHRPNRALAHGGKDQGERARRWRPHPPRPDRW